MRSLRSPVPMALRRSLASCSAWLCRCSSYSRARRMRNALALLECWLRSSCRGLGGGWASRARGRQGARCKGAAVGRQAAGRSRRRPGQARGRPKHRPWATAAPPPHLAGHHQAGGQVRQPHGAVRGVDVLPARAAGPVQVHPHVPLPYDNIYLVRLWQHHHRRRAGVHAAVALGGGHALHAVHARLELEAAVHAAAAELRAGVLAAADLGLGVL
jgi:hypothetical protein